MSAEQPRQEEEESGLETATAKLMINVAKHLTKYAYDNLWKLIYTDEGGVRLPEVHDWLRLHANPNTLTNDDLAEALEQAGEKYMRVSYVNDMLNGIENRWLKAMVNSGIGFSQRLLKHRPDFIRELQTKKDSIILTFLQRDPNMLEYYKGLEHRPKLRRFIMEAFMTKMGIPLEPAAALSIPKPAPAGAGIA